ncbi:amidohydrolase family protein [Solitalea sp. MAHUQ-68]|uniref:Amidohydrolase family protein n=1 Tax=Solitalea agri TaxID=2953739 RepID=A0A9X2F2V8_9SPHI|nr:amidohydrolase family protein [Solitalea agri]MCO4293135.1 amidohydrolase family protein [Solitalea agri]
MRKISADWIFTLSLPPIKNGVVVIDDMGKVLDVLSSKDGLENVEVVSGVICPGFINAHCHLELSHLKGKLPQKTGLVDFIRNVQQFRNASEEEVLNAIEIAENEMVANGIVGVGDISNTANTFNQKAKHRLNYHTFIEVFGFNPDNAGIIYHKAEQLLQVAPQTASITPHAPYSVSAKLFSLIDQSSLLSIHNQETIHENAFYKDKSGDFLKLYEGFNLDLSFFQPHGNNSIKTYLEWMGESKKLLVHNTYTDSNDVDFAESISYNFWCLCPNANLYIENKLPDVSMLINKGVKMVLGTDSLASNFQLSILEEMKTISLHFSSVDLEQLLKWACRNGAEFFGWSELGRIERDKSPGLNLIEGFSIDESTGKIFLKPQSTVKKIC